MNWISILLDKNDFRSVSKVQKGVYKNQELVLGIKQDSIRIGLALMMLALM